MNRLRAKPEVAKQLELEKAKLPLKGSSKAKSCKYIVVQHDMYVGILIQNPFRSAQMHSSHPQVAVGHWEASVKGRWPDFPEVAEELQRPWAAVGLELLTSALLLTVLLRY